MNSSERMIRNTALNMQKVFCATHGIEPTMPINGHQNFDKYFAMYRRYGFSEPQSQDLAWERCEKEVL